MPRRVIPAVMVASAALGACTAGIASDSAVLVVQNRSDATIVDIRLTPADNPSFGTNLLAGEALPPGQEAALGVSCGRLDARLVDASGATCELSSLDLCANDAHWVITNQTCPRFGSGQQTP